MRGNSEKPHFLLSGASRRSKRNSIYLLRVQETSKNNQGNQNLTFPYRGRKTTIQADSHRSSKTRIIMSQPIGVAIIGSGRSQVLDAYASPKHTWKLTVVNRHLRQRTTPPSRPSQLRPRAQSNLLSLSHQRPERLFLPLKHRPLLRRQQATLRASFSLRHSCRDHCAAHSGPTSIHQAGPHRRQACSGREADRQRCRGSSRADPVVRQQHRQEQSVFRHC
jgi:hypothetical protein